MPIFADGKLSKFRSVFTSGGTRDCLGNNLKTFNARHASLDDRRWVPNFRRLVSVRVGREGDDNRAAKIKRPRVN